MPRDVWLGAEWTGFDDTVVASARRHDRSSHWYMRCGINGDGTMASRLSARACSTKY